ncbi:hypothetical protein EJ08DRAFT_403858 [Tothia fuscella]|uniref:Uncharacterized protein n=1 Tax=Tothia fuscella TaxID=1048955 RepID=A0A9P4TVH9_9PEZI|nr:hypothetical protein EJ08DRAFT_403858 [Tothia fuscella]
MYKQSGSSNFSTVRATWEAREQSPSKPLLAVANTPNTTIAALTPLTQLPNGVRRLSSRSFTMFNGQFNPFRSKGPRKSSSNETDAKRSTNNNFPKTGSRESSTNVSAHQDGSYMVLSSSLPDATALPRSRTMSFLPVPTKSATKQERPPLVTSKSTASLFRSHIPKTQIPSAPKSDKGKGNVATRAFTNLRKSSSSYLTRSATQPNLTTIAGRKASEIPRQTVHKPSFTSEIAPLLESEEEDEEPSPKSQRRLTNATFKYPQANTGFTPARMDALDTLPQQNNVAEPEFQFGPSVSRTTPPNEGIEELDTPQTVRPFRMVRRSEPQLSSSPHVVPVHRLLSPVQPISPPCPLRSPPLPPPSMITVFSLNAGSSDNPTRSPSTPEFVFHKETSANKEVARNPIYKKATPPHLHSSAREDSGEQKTVRPIDEHSRGQKRTGRSRLFDASAERGRPRTPNSRPRRDTEDQAPVTVRQNHDRERYQKLMVTDRPRASEQKSESHGSHESHESDDLFHIGISMAEIRISGNSAGLRGVSDGLHHVNQRRSSGGLGRMSLRDASDGHDRVGSQDIGGPRPLIRRKESEQSPSQGRGAQVPPAQDPRLVHEEQPTSYWAGRFMGARDRLLDARNGDFLTSEESITSPSAAEAEIQQTILIFEKIENSCMTEEATHSLWQFRNQWARKNNMPSVVRDIPVERSSQLSGDLGLGNDTYWRQRQDQERKPSFLERFTGRARKSSGRSERSVPGDDDGSLLRRYG